MPDPMRQGETEPGRVTAPPPLPVIRPGGLGGDPGPYPKQPGLMRGLNSLVRGLTALFYALPIALLIIVWTATRSGSSVPSPVSNLLHSLGILPALAASGLMFYGVLKLGRFQPDFIAWQRSVGRARWCGLLLIGFSPFLYWWCRLPEIIYFRVSAITLIVISMLFLAQLNVVLRRLTAILPDQTLRAETAFMARFNHVILAVVGLAEVFFFSLNRLSIADATVWLTQQHLWLLRLMEIIVLLMMVMPIAITMAVMWKVKEVILESVFQGDE